MTEFKEIYNKTLKESQHLTERLQILYEELIEIDSILLETFIENSKEDEELNSVVNTSLKDLPFYQYLTTDEKVLDKTIIDIIVGCFEKKHLSNYFVTDISDRIIGFVSYHKTDDIVGDFKLLKFYKDVSTMEDTLELMNRMIRENKHVMFSCYYDNPVSKPYEIFCKRKEREGYRIEIEDDKDEGEFVYHIYND